MPAPIDLAAVLDTFDDTWSPRTVTVVNDYDVRVVKVLGEFTRHRHSDTDELFLVLKGSLTIHLEGDEVVLGPGQMFVVPRGQLHQPAAEVETHVLLLEPSDTVNTGDSPGGLTA